MPQEIARDFFIYGVSFLGLAPGASATNSVSIQADSDFIAQKLAYSADLAGASQTDSSRVIALCDVLITDTGSGRQLMNSGVPISCFFGQGDSPFILPQPKIFRANTLISVTVTNNSAADTYNLKLSFIGVKSFQG